MTALLWFFVAWSALGNAGVMVRAGQAKNATVAEAVGSGLAVATDVALTVFLVWLAIHGFDS